MSHEWYDNGQVKSEGEYELSVCIKEKEWDEEGNLTREYAIDPNSPQFSTLQRLRAWRYKG
jgi:antitoxin component YwqK of YwqJK toxin-antitoxin module